MSPVSHIIASGVISSIFGLVTQSLQASLACFVGGIFMDIDHFFDYCLHHKKVICSFKELKDYCFHEREGKMFLVFHAWEIICILWIIVYYFQLGLFWIGLLLGMSAHLFLDQVCNDWQEKTHLLAYFGFFRLKHGFKKKVIHRDTYQKPKR